MTRPTNSQFLFFFFLPQTLIQIFAQIKSKNEECKANYKSNLCNLGKLYCTQNL